MSLWHRGQRVPEPDDQTTPVDRLEVHMLAAIAKGDAALAAYTRTRNVKDLVDGLLDVRNRLVKGLPTS